MATTPAVFSFRPMVDDDIPMFREWVVRPHVAEFWPDPPQLEELQAWCASAADPLQHERHYIALLGGTEPVGFIQTYVPVECHQDGWWLDEHDSGVRGIDQFLANAEQLGRGLGSALIRAFSAHVFADATVTRIQCDPAPNNRRAIRCYEKAGFHADREVVTPDGPALLMYLERPRLAG